MKGDEVYSHMHLHVVGVGVVVINILYKNFDTLKAERGRVRRRITSRCWEHNIKSLTRTCYFILFIFTTFHMLTNLGLHMYMYTYVLFDLYRECIYIGIYSHFHWEKLTLSFWGWKHAWEVPYTYFLPSIYEPTQLQ